MTRHHREFHQYLAEPTDSHVGQDDYLISPASAFLRYTVEAKDAINLCSRSFKKKNNGDYRKDSLDSLQHLISAILPAIMGHFETFQRYLFAGMFECSVYLENFDSDAFFRSLKADGVDPKMLAAYRSTEVAPIGFLLANTLTGWHDPKKVNAIFNSFSLNRALFSTQSQERLRVLWQLRHSIVHTGGTLTIPDAQKVNVLAPFGGHKVVFENHFVTEVSRKLHQLVKESTEGMGVAFKSRLVPYLDPSAANQIDSLFEVASTYSVWLS